MGAALAEVLVEGLKCRAYMCRWKLVHGDVFRAPRALELLAALVGTGVQLALLVLSVILITIAGAALSPPVHGLHCMPPWWAPLQALCSA